MKKNLIFTLVVSSLLMPSIEAIQRTSDLNSLENENNIYETVDILIASGMSMEEKRKKKERQKKAQEIRKRQKAEKELKEQPTGEYGGIPVRIDYEKELKEQPTGEYGGIPVRIDYEEEIKGNKNNNSGNQQKKKPQDNKTDKKLLKEIIDDRRKFIEAERKDPGITYYEKAKDKVSYLIKKTAASNPSPSDDFFEFTDKKYARLKELELIKNFIDIVVYESVHSGRDFADYYLGSNKKLPRKLQLRKEIYEKQYSLVSKINRKAYSEEIRILLYQLVEGSGLIKFKMRGLYGGMSSNDDD